MPYVDAERLRAIKSFPSLVKYLRDELDWPVESEDFDDLTYDYEPEELGLDKKTSAKIKGIKQLRPLTSDQPFGIFFVNFDPKKLPVVVLRRVLGALVIKKRTSTVRSEQASWKQHDLLFISSYGEEEERTISFAYFKEDQFQPADLPTLMVLGWDDRDTVLHLDHTHQNLKENLRWPEDESQTDLWRDQWASVFTLKHREVISTAQSLATRLAELARKVRNRINAVLEVEHESGPVRALHQAFKEALIHDLTEDDFADTYAQTIAYGLLSARISREAGIVADNIVDMVPVTNPFLQELLETFLHVGGRKRKRGGNLDFDELGVSEVVELLRNANMDAVLRDFGDRNPQEDPVIHFYEDFLKEYDRQKRTSRGVFYTPKPVVSFIVRSVHELLQKEFNLEDGLADTTTWGEMMARNPGLSLPEHTSSSDPFVTILDPATGTATFLVEVIELIYDTLLKKWQTQKKSQKEIQLLWNQYVPKHLLPRLFGYELMMAPYAIANMKIGLVLQSTGYQFHTDERVRVYLTNSLEPPQDFSDRFQFDIPALAHEAEAVNEVKEKQRFTVVIGNPPYFGEAGRGGEWIASLMRGVDLSTKKTTSNYFEVDGKPLGERNTKWLNDDYVKFMRLAEWHLQQNNVGVLGFITNNSYLDSPTFRGMRHSFMSTFSHLYFYDLHGSLKRNEKCPDGTADENIFDIEQGVAVSLFSRHPKHTSCFVQLSHLFGKRLDKYNSLVSDSIASLKWQTIEPLKDLYLFSAYDNKLFMEYSQWPLITDLFPIKSVGFVSARDRLAVQDSHAAIWKVVNKFLQLPPEDARTTFNLGKDAIDWKVSSAQEDLHASGPEINHVVPLLYRPFDERYTYYTGRSRGFICRPRHDVMRHLIAGNNIALLTCRQRTGQDGWAHVFCGSHIVDSTVISNKTREINYVFPLCLTPEWPEDTRRINMSEQALSFVQELTKAPKSTFSSAPPDNIIWEDDSKAMDFFAYVYAILHSCSYRYRYDEFLRSDFPRVPVSISLDLYNTLLLLGRKLVASHLLTLDNSGSSTGSFSGSTDPVVESVSYQNQTIWLNNIRSVGFKNIPEEVWDFQVGCYQICDKWLKDRRGRTLSPEEIAHYQKIIFAIQETIRIMAEIDAVIDEYGGWPDAFVTEPMEGNEESDELPFA